MLDIILPSVIFAAIIYTLHQLPKRFNAKPHPHRLTQPGEAGWTFEIMGRTLSLYTTAFNYIPRSIVASWPPISRVSYDLGSIAGALGSLAAVGGALWALGQVWMAVWKEASDHAMQKAVVDDAVVGMRRRAVEILASTPVPDPASVSGGLQPLIPGVTVPLSHFPTLALALFVNQLVHELGHAFAAAFEGIAMSRLSISLHVVIPSMMVSFSSAVDSLPSLAKLRLASSGPWHNLLTYLLIVSMGASGLSRIYWTHYGSLGRVVDSVDPHSPLYSHISAGMLITHLDDVFIGGEEDTWQTYLSGSDIGDAGRGWCVERDTYQALPSAPCSGIREITFQHALISQTSNFEPRCMAPYPILDVPSGACPCPGNKWICVRPAPEENILRIQLDGRNRHKQSVILWAGERRGVLEDVKVGKEGARFAGPFVRWGTLFLQYLASIALSLYFFNLLPLPGTDGSQLLRAMLSLTRSQHHTSPTPLQKPIQATLASSTRMNSPTININAYREYELSDDEDMGDEEEGRRSRREDRWKTRLRKSVEAGCVAILVGWGAGWAMLGLLRSS